MTRWVRVAIALLLTLAVAACSGGGSSPTSRPTEAPTSEPTSEPTEATLAVPDIVDETEQDGLVALGAAGLAAGARSRAYSDDFDSGRIVSTDPKAGVIVARGTAIDYVVSRGPRPTPSPTAKATAKPTATPTAKPTARPTAGPTSEPTLTPATPPATEPVPTTAPVELPLPGTAWVLAANVDDASTTVDSLQAGVHRRLLGHRHLGHGRVQPVQRSLCRRA
ncbi:MAG: PASTA domain-containing protein [Chloroflexota bacterium]